MFWALRSHPDIWRNGNAASWILWFGALTFYPPCALSHFIPWKPLTRVPCTSVCSCVLWLELVCECVFWFSTNGLYIAHFCVLFRIAQFWSWLPYSPFIWEEGEFTPLCLSKGRNAALWTSVTRARCSTLRLQEENRFGGLTRRLVWVAVISDFLFGSELIPGSWVCSVC